MCICVYDNENSFWWAHMTSWGYILTGMARVLLVWLSSDPFIWPNFPWFSCGNNWYVICQSDSWVNELQITKGYRFQPLGNWLNNIRCQWPFWHSEGSWDALSYVGRLDWWGIFIWSIGECIGWLLDDEGAEGWGLWGCVGVLAWSLPSMGSGNMGLSSSLPRFDPDAIISLNAVLALLFIHSSISSSLNLENFAVSFSHACFKRMISFLVEMSDGSQNFLRGHLLMTMP